MTLKSGILVMPLAPFKLESFLQTGAQTSATFLYKLIYFQSWNFFSTLLVNNNKEWASYNEKYCMLKNKVQMNGGLKNLIKNFVSNIYRFIN